MQRVIIIFLLFILSVKAEVPIQLSPVDYPFNSYNDEFTAPSMLQALDVSTNFYNLTHTVIEKKLLDKGWDPFFPILFFDIVWASWPFGLAWIHEEYHRAVLSQEGISSYNDVYNFPTSDIIAVSHLKDSALKKFKKENPAGFVRMSAAGMEAQMEMNLRLNYDYFFFDSREQLFAQYYNAFGNIAYMNACIYSDDRVDQQIDDEGTDISKRDFTGFDCLAWTYDLHRPNESYSERGIHPSGKGIDRYIQYSDLTREEKDYLILNANLSFLNLVNPFFFRKKEFDWNNDLKYNFAFAHYMTSFGHAIDNRFYLKMDGSRYLFIFHHYFNRSRYFQGLEFKDIDRQLEGKYLGDARIMLWNQPEDQSFYSKSSSLGGLISQRIYYLYSNQHRPYIEIEAKTQGWVASNPSLDPSMALRIGHKYLF